MLLAIANLVGAAIALTILSVAWSSLVRRFSKRVARTLFETLAVEHVISPERARIEIDFIEKGGEYTPLDEATRDAFTRWSSQRYSSELLRNRVADLCGVAMIIWQWGTNIVELVIFAGAIYLVVTDGASSAVSAWLIVPVWFALISLGVMVGAACKLVTGRYPGQARAARRALATSIFNSDRAARD